MDSKTNFVVRCDGEISIMSGDEIINNYKCRLNSENNVDGLEIVGMNSSFVKVESVFVRRTTKQEKLFNVSVDSCRNIVLTYNYPCLVIDEDRKLTCVKNTVELLPMENRIPMGKILQMCLPSRNSRKLGSIKHLLQADKGNGGLKNFFVATPLESVSTLDSDGGVKLISFNVNTDNRPYVQTAFGMLLRS